MRTRPTTVLLLALALCLWLAGAAEAGTITLKPSARVGAGAPILLADVALLDGDDAEALAAVEVAPAPPASAEARGFLELNLQQVRDAVDRAGVNWGRIALRGSVCVVRVGGSRPAPDAEPAPVVRTHEAVPMEGPRTVRTRVASLLASLLDVDHQDLRVLFDDRDADFLDLREWGRRVEIQPNSTGTSSRQSLTVRVYEGESMVESRTIRADTLVRRDVVTLRAGVRRGDTLGPEHVQAQSLWMDPGGTAPVASLQDAVGMVMATRVGAGDVLRVNQVNAPVLVRRGELVTVHCISGGVALKVKARAMSDGKQGELVEMRIEGSDGGFRARVTARATAVVDVDARSASEDGS